jgi:hypothetical protein
VRTLTFSSAKKINMWSKRKKAVKPEKRGIVEPGVTESRGMVIED